MLTISSSLTTCVSVGVYVRTPFEVYHTSLDHIVSFLQILYLCTVCLYMCSVSVSLCVCVSRMQGGGGVGVECA